jgi:hypothetical protein
MTILKELGRRIAAFFGGRAAPVKPEMRPPVQPDAGEPKWLQLARADLGIRELPGAVANPAIMRAWQYCDFKPPAGNETAWCSAKANEWLQCAGLPGTRQPNARSWLKWGAGLDTPGPAVSLCSGAAHGTLGRLDHRCYRCRECLTTRGRPHMAHYKAVRSAFCGYSQLRPKVGINPLTPRRLAR